MDRVVPWPALIELIAPYYPKDRTGRPPFALETMLRVHFLQLWFTLSDPVMEEAFFDTPLYREFAQLQELTRLPNESTLLRFRHRLGKHKLAGPILATVNDGACRAWPTAQGRHRGGRHPDCCAKLDEEQGRLARPQGAFISKGQLVALWHEGTHWRGCRIGSGAHGQGHFGQRQSCSRRQCCASSRGESRFRDAGYQGVDKRADA